MTMSVGVDPLVLLVNVTNWHLERADEERKAGHTQAAERHLAIAVGLEHELSVAPATMRRRESES